ncbi:hypothetical protein FQZ97_592880 [compost metagenome]
MRANSATTSMSALRTWRDSCCDQRWSTSSSVVSCSGRVSRSRTGSIMEYGRQMFSSPPVAPNSMWKEVTTTTSLLPVMLANLVCISDRTYSNSIG